MTKSPITPHRTRLTKRSVDAAKPAQKRFIVWDTDIAGFGLRIEPSGRKTFIARYRAGGGRAGILRQATIGRYGTLTPDEARARARQLLGRAAGGGDPVGDSKRARQTGVTVGEVMDWYLTEASTGRLLGRHGQQIKASTIEMDRSRIEAHVKPLIGHKPVSALRTTELEAMQADIAIGKVRRHRASGNARGGRTTGGSGVAARTLGMIGAIFEHARRAGIISSNPARGARKLAGSRRTRRLTLDEVRLLGRAIADGNGNPVAIAAIRFTLLSGFRRNETLSLRIGDILPAGGVDLSDSKSGSQIRPIGREAMSVLTERTAQTDRGGAGWVFPAERGDGHFVGLPKVLSRLCYDAGLENVTVHTLRHTFASVAGDLGFSELVIAGLLGHSGGSVTRGYVHLDRALVTAADRVSTAMARALDNKSEAELVAFDAKLHHTS